MTCLIKYSINYQRGDFCAKRARVKSEIYHIIMRKINRQTLFEDEEDCAKLIQILKKYKEVCEYKVYTYCLMRNHLHILLKEGKEPLETVMRRICGSYVLWYNKKYDMVGYLFQDRFKSEPVEDKEYFLTALRYIFQNPLKVGITNEVKKYVWTNYSDYMGNSKITDTDFVLNLFNETDREKALRSFIEYINRKNGDECMDVTEKQRLTDDEAKKIINAYYKIEQGIDLQNFKRLKEIYI